ncbi:MULTISPECIES: PAQR family membrane homeostasis protein TrhA [Roseobacteraceae]|jgi:hemolysin III|uniref:Hemolysin-III related n=1 Tax=Pseudosulfitobacter pseudonitzschiae TaxID=1402135 RepID=A0A221JX12_9RHOB|nr:MULTISPECIES: hemolysin III family protein [Roseobacteraceae]ASM71264.1 hemolysin-III related [Pseudosulfitobacter pseudonitzschiae]
MAYPRSLTETLADGSVHVIGLTGSVVGAAILLGQIIPHAPVTTVASVGIYLAVLVFAFAASASYHLLPWDRSRPILARVDHAAIYLKIAGTYTPLVFVLGSVTGYIVLAFVWLVALGGAIAKLSFWATDGRGSLALYLALGWASVLLIWPMWSSLSGAAMTLVAAGGLTYSAGAVFFAMREFRFQMALWHVFVVVASACFFAAIALSV